VPGAHTRRLQLRVEPGFDLPLVLFSHGWIDLVPHSWDAATRTFDTALLLDRHAVDLRVRHNSGRITAAVFSRRPITAASAAAVRAAVIRMLRLGENLQGFWALCENHPRLSWVVRRQAGRIFRSATLFEDLLKLLFTTNCSWAATRKMTERLVGALGKETPSGRRAFPTPAACAGQGEAFFQDEVRAGYRARACRELAEGFATGALTEQDLTDPDLATAEVRQRLLGVRGFGPYAAGQALRLLGRYEDLALDSWCRGRLATIQRRRKPPSDAAIARRYAAFGEYRGLALWMDLTAGWHGELEGTGKQVLRAQAD
jgi:N-glycosylase/DNA lyase